MLTNHVQIGSKINDGLNSQQKNNNFKVHLKKPIYLKHGAKIALTDISFLNSISNIPEFVSEKKIVVSSKPFSFKIDIFPSANEDPRMRRLLGKYMEFTYPIKGGKQHFGINYIAKFYQTDTFELPKVKIEFTNETRNLYGIEGDVTVSKGENFVSSKPILDTGIFIHKVRITIEPFRGYFTMKKGNCSTLNCIIQNLVSNLDLNLTMLLQIHNHQGHLRIKQTSEANRRNLLARLEIPSEMKKLLGLEQNDAADLDEETRQFTSRHLLELYALYPGVMVCYTDFVSHSIIGDQFYPVFKMIPLQKITENDNCVSIHFKNFEFLKCNMARLDKLRFQLKRLDGGFIDFHNNKKIIMNLAIQNPK